MNRRTVHARQRGAALLLAMIILTLVSTVAAGMVWQQSRAVEIESAERRRVQMQALSLAALDFARGALRQGFGNNVTPQRIRDLPNYAIQRRSLKGVLAVDPNNSLDDEARGYISVSGGDASTRYNLRRLFGQEAPNPAELATLRRLFSALNLPVSQADQLAAGLQAAWKRGSQNADATTAIAPQRLADLAWLGVDEATLKVLQRYADIFPEGEQVTVNLNEAPWELIYAAIDGLTPSDARAIQAKAAAAVVTDLAQLTLPAEAKVDTTRVSLVSRHFYAELKLEYEDMELNERYLIHYAGNLPGGVRVLRRWNEFSKAPTK